MSVSALRHPTPRHPRRRVGRGRAEQFRHRIGIFLSDEETIIGGEDEFIGPTRPSMFGAMGQNAFFERLSLFCNAKSHRFRSSLYIIKTRESRVYHPVRRRHKTLTITSRDSNLADHRAAVGRIGIQALSCLGINQADVDRYSPRRTGIGISIIESKT